VENGLKSQWLDTLHEMCVKSFDPSAGKAWFRRNPKQLFGFSKGGMPGKRQFDRVLFQRILFNHFLLL